MRILVADDSPVIRTAVSVVLEDAGYEVVTAADGIEAIQKFYEERPDLVVMDIQMPNMTGYMACRLLKEDWSVAHIPVLILTAHDSAEDRYWADKSGADGYLTKESLGEELLVAIRSATVSRALSDIGGFRRPEHEALDQVDVLARVTQMLDRKLFEMTIVNDIVTLATRSMDLRSAVTETMFILRRFVAYDAAAISLVDEKVVATRLDRPVHQSDLDAFVEAAGREMVQRAAARYSVEDMTPWRCDTLHLAEAPRLAEGWRSMFSIDLRVRGDVVGTLTLGAARPEAFSPQVARTLRTVEQAVATLINSVLHYQRLIEEEARRSLSSLYEPND